MSAGERCATAGDEGRGAWAGPEQACKTIAVGWPAKMRASGTSFRKLHSASNLQEVAMKALVWHGRNDVRCDTVPDPRIEAPRDAIIRVTSTAICGSDLHLYDGYIPAMESGDILGHEFMGEVVEVGPENH